jgi:hypothetical protein
MSIRASDLGDHDLEGLKVKNVRDCEFAKYKGDCDEGAIDDSSFDRWHDDSKDYP